MENKRPKDWTPEHSNTDEKGEEEPAKETKKYGVSRRRAWSDMSNDADRSKKIRTELVHWM